MVKIIDQKDTSDTFSSKDEEIEKKINQTIKSITQHLEKFEFNTIDCLMKLNNDLAII